MSLDASDTVMQSCKGRTTLTLKSKFACCQFFFLGAHHFTWCFDQAACHALAVLYYDNLMMYEPPWESR